MLILSANFTLHRTFQSGKCEQCPGVEPVVETIMELLSHNAITTITCKQWLQNDR